MAANPIVTRCRHCEAQSEDLSHLRLCPRCDGMPRVRHLYLGRYGRLSAAYVRHLERLRYLASREMPLEPELARRPKEIYE